MLISDYPTIEALAEELNPVCRKILDLTSSLNARQFMDFVLLHELSHTFGYDDAQVDNKNIWQACKWILAPPPVVID